MANIILGALGLAVLEGIVSSKQASANVGGAIGKLAKGVAWFVSPAVPAFKNAAAATSSTSLAVETATSAEQQNTAGTAGSSSAATAPALSASPYASLGNLPGSTY